MSTALKQTTSRYINRLRRSCAPWYHKQFNAYPLTLGLVATGCLRYGKKLLRWSPKVCVCVYAKGIGDWYWHEPELLALRRKMIASQLRDPAFFKRIARGRALADKRFSHALARFLKADLTSLPLPALRALYREVEEPFLEQWGWGVASEPFLGRGESWLASELSRELQTRFGKGWQQALQVLATPKTSSFATAQHRSLLHLATRLRKLKRTVKTLRVGSLPVSLKHQLSIHTAEYYWTEDNYGISRGHDERTFFVRALALARSGNPASELHKDLRRSQHALTSKRVLLRRLSARTKRLVALSDMLSAFVDQRKSTVFRMARVWFSLTAELARRYRIPQQELLMLTTEEFDGFLRTAFLGRAEAQRRRKRCTVISTPREDVPLSGTCFGNFRFFQGDSVLGSQRSLRGLCASAGHAVGRVRIVRLSRDIATVRRGEILIANQTTPDYAPAMRKAAAIVTEQGGITSHAAVVSRELGIPCIIGTVHATRVFKTGDRIEVDATAGVVRKL